MASSKKKRQSSVENNDEEWKIIYVPRVGQRGKISKPEQVLMTTALEQKWPYGARDQLADALDLRYIVEPKSQWKEMDKYHACIAFGEKYTRGDFVFVKPGGGEETPVKTEVDESDVHNSWVARVLEIRAKHAEHVYARVYWLYWPEELPVTKDSSIFARGRRSYHGRHELVVSNHMDIIDVCSLAGKAHVEHWVEDDEGEELFGLYWRQTYNHRTAQLSDLQKYCLCQSHCNPDKVLFACPDTDCKLWLHSECLVHDILTKTYNSLILGGKSTINVTNKVSKGKKRKRTEIEKPYESLFAADIIGSHAVITDLRLNIGAVGRTWTEEILCPKCATKMS